MVKINLTTVLLLVLIVSFIVLLTIVCKSESFESNNSTPESEKKNSIEKDNILIFYAPWCGHCKRSMNDFIEATKKSDGKVKMFNSEDPESRELMKKYNVHGFPTIIKATGEVYSGPRTSSDILNFKGNGNNNQNNNYDTMIFYAPWCGHCKRAMNEFVKAERYSNGKVKMFNSEDPESRELMKKYNVHGFPTIIKATGEVYSGPRISESIIDFSNE